MKKILALAVCVALSLGVHAQSIGPKLSPQIMKLAYDLKHRDSGDNPLQNIARRKHADGKWYASAMIQVSDAALAAAGLRALDAATGTKAGNIWTVHVPLDKLLPFTQLAGVSYIELDEAVYPEMFKARKATRVDSVHAGINLPMAYTGKDVIVGVIDFGFDYTHPTFYDTTGHGYRIRKVWELNGTGTPPAGYTYGNEILDSNNIRSRGTDNLQQMHGTSTASITAGSGYNTNDTTGNAYRGVAFESDLILVGVRRDTIGNQWMQGTFTDFVDGINYIFTQAAAAGKPAVVNISWGSQSGPHNGTTLFNQACNNLSGPGKIVVMSAGNEGEENIHLSKTFTTADTVVSTFLTFEAFSGVADYKRTWIDIWGDTGKSFCVNTTLYNLNTAGDATGFFCLDDTVHDTYLLGSNGLDTCFVSYIGTTSAFNGKPRLIMNIWNKTPDNVNIKVSGTNGMVHMWNEYYFYGFTHGYQSEFSSLNKPGAVNGNAQYTASDMGSAERVLLVGAYASKVSYYDINSVYHSYNGYAGIGSVVPFSSRGPLTDGRIKPDITAPGLTLATAVPSHDTAFSETGSSQGTTVSGFLFNGKKYYYGEFIGTSASAPMASGIVALMLQVKPDLTPEEVKDVIFSTAIEDNNTGNIPDVGNNNWGHGKINAYGAVRKLVKELSVYDYAGTALDCVLYPNPNSGNFMLDYQGNNVDNLLIQVYDMSGRVVSSVAWQVSSGSNRKTLSLGSVARGIYLVKVTGSKGAVSIRTAVQ